MDPRSGCLGKGDTLVPWQSTCSTLPWFQGQDSALLLPHQHPQLPESGWWHNHCSPLQPSLPTGPLHHGRGHVFCPPEWLGGQEPWKESQDREVRGRLKGGFGTSAASLYLHPTPGEGTKQVRQAPAGRRHIPSLKPCSHLGGSKATYLKCQTITNLSPFPKGFRSQSTSSAKSLPFLPTTNIATGTTGWIVLPTATRQQIHTKDEFSPQSQTTGTETSTPPASSPHQSTKHQTEDSEDWGFSTSQTSPC